MFFSLSPNAARLLDQTDNLTITWKTIQLFLGKNLFLIYTDNKYTTGTRN